MPYSFLSHLECSRTGDVYDADRVQGVSKVGAPLLARYAAIRGIRLGGFLNLRLMNGC